LWILLGGGEDMAIIDPIWNKKRRISSQWHWKLVRFSTTQSMIWKKLLKYQQDWDENWKCYVQRGGWEHRFKGWLERVLGWGPNKMANFSQDVNNWESHV
jgi:hypothetical protein